MKTICPIKSCGIPIPRARLMCLTHWRRVPREIQKWVWRAWRRNRMDWLRAREAAIAVVEGKAS